MRTSAGLLPYRVVDGSIEVFLVHMGGPFWARKDEGAWSLAKGEYVRGEEEPLEVAEREFAEEVGRPAPTGERLPLGEVRQSGKVVTAYAVLTDEDLAFVRSNVVQIEWPPRSGRMIGVPEVDRAGWMTLEQARVRLVKGQRAFLDRLPVPGEG